MEKRLWGVKIWAYYDYRKKPNFSLFCFDSHIGNGFYRFVERPRKKGTHVLRTIVVDETAMMNGIIRPFLLDCDLWERPK